MAPILALVEFSFAQVTEVRFLLECMLQSINAGAKTLITFEKRLFFKVPTCENCSINALSHCKDFMTIINETKDFDIVLDFSAYEPKWVSEYSALRHNSILS